MPFTALQMKGFIESKYNSVRETPRDTLRVIGDHYDNTLWLKKADIPFPDPAVTRPDRPF
jgi:hypothetical protein